MVKTIAFGIMAMSVIGFATGLNAAQEYVLAQRFGVASHDNKPHGILFSSKEHGEGMLTLNNNNGQSSLMSSNMLMMTDTNNKARLIIRVTDDGAEMAFLDKNEKILKKFSF